MADAASEARLARARQLLRGLLDETDLARGYQYARAGRGRISTERGNAERVELESTCVGSRAAPYFQTLALGFDRTGKLVALQGRCSCPMALDCKHVACVAINWLALRPALGLPSVRPGPTVPAPVIVSREAQEWLERFGRTLSRPAATPSIGECVVYALRDDGGELKVLKARILKDGSIRVSGAPDLSWLYTRREGPGYLSLPDMAACNALTRLSRSVFGDSWSIEGEAGRVALDRALATGRMRCFDAVEWGAGRPPLRLDSPGWLRRGAAVSARLRLVEGERGGRTWGVDSEPERRGLVAIACDPPAYLDRSRAEIGDLELDVIPAVAAQLLRMPEIDDPGAAAFFSSLDAAARAHGLEGVSKRIPAELVIKPVRPQARLRFARGRFREFGRGRAADRERWVAELWFDYPQGVCLEDSAQAGGALRWRDASGIERVLLRDRPAEAEVRRRLAAAGFVPLVASGYVALHRLDANRACMSPGDGSAAAWAGAAPRLLDAAAAAGMRIDADPGFPYRLHEASEVHESLIPGDSPQWFDLELGVDVDGARVPIVAALTDWIARTPRPVQWLENAGEGSVAILDAGQGFLIRIPATRLRQLLMPLIDALGFERPLVGGKLRLSRVEAALLATAPSRPSADLTALRERLGDFRGVASAPPAASFRARLRPYQQAGLDWLQFLRELDLAGILADDMGLGKTVQALAHLQLEKASGRADRPSLVVAPTSVLPNWWEEARRFTPDLRVLLLHGAKRGELHARIREADLVLTSYPLLARDREVLEAQSFHVVVFDEAQFLKNALTRTRAAAAALDARHRIALTGTPIENQLGELWSHFDLLLPGFLGDAKQFNRAWRNPIEKEADAERLARLVRRVRPFILRRTRAEVLDDLPEKTEIVRHVELQGAQRDLYEALRLAMDRKLRQAIGNKGIAGSQIVILDALLKLRQACCDPRLVKAPAAKAAHGVSAKLEALREMLGELRAEGKRVLLFSQFTSMLDLIEPELPALGIAHVRLDGSTADRSTPVKRFQAGEANVFLISLRAGGTGLNLTAADTVIHYDPWWNPAVEAQATARAHRIGQDKAVFVYKLIARETVEERIQELLKRKQALADALLGEGRPGGTLITEEDIQALLAPLADAL